MSRTIAITNQKGGVGKTTTAINLAAALAEAGRRALVVDLDPQGNASTGLGVAVAGRRLTTFDMLLDGAPLAEVAVPTGIDGVSLAPATTDLASVDVQLAADAGRAVLLREALRPAGDLGFDYVLLDCPPSLNLLTLNALVASGGVLVPLQAEFFALEGLSQLVLSVREVRASANPGLRMEGVVLTMYDRRNRLARAVEEDARATLGELVFRTVIPRNVRLSEAPSHGISVLEYDGASAGALAYRALAGELEARRIEQEEAA